MRHVVACLLLLSLCLVRISSFHLRMISSANDPLSCFDEACVFVRGGSGGQGSNTFQFGKSRQCSRPFGGSGGDGGSVFLVGDRSANTLHRFQSLRSFRAPNGGDGDIRFANGVDGEDVKVPVPLGTNVFDNSSQALLGSILTAEDTLLVARGGAGGRGNAAEKATKGVRVGCTPAQGGERRWLRLELQLIADVGLLGVPNAGKSTLLNALTNAKPKIADYAFTTLVPNLGVCVVPAGEDHERKWDEQAMVIADIPGLIEGAHAGVGLGKGFLRHVERCKVLLHILNGCSADAVADYLAINQELLLYSPLLAAKPQIVVFNKMDLPGVKDAWPRVRERLAKVMPHSRLLTISAASRDGLADLRDKTWKFLQRVTRQQSN